MRRALVIPFLLLVPSSEARSRTPLDVFDPTSRSVEFAVEISPEPNVVGQTFGPARSASWSSDGSTGTLIIAAATHEELRTGGGWTAVPGSFEPIVIEIDLATLEATSLPASGAIQSGNLSSSFTQNALDSTAVVGYIGPDVEPFICTSQAEVDALCAVAPEFCGQACIPVAGSAYDPDSGLVNLVGSETRTDCDGGQCFGPYDFVATLGDLRLDEASAPPAVPVLPPAAGIGLVGLLILTARGALLARGISG